MPTVSLIFAISLGDKSPLLPTKNDSKALSASPSELNSALQTFSTSEVYAAVEMMHVLKEVVQSHPEIWRRNPLVICI